MSGPVALICGEGRFPLVAAKAAQQGGREVFLLALKGVADPGVENFPHVWLGVGQLGAALREIERAGAKKLCFIGGLGRPEFADLRPDWGAIRRIPEILRLLKGGDDHALKGVIKLFEQEGLEVIGVESLAPQLVAAKGAMNRLALPKNFAEDLDFGRACLSAMSAFDVGQGLVLNHRRIVALEAAEGTDAMLERVAHLRDIGRWRAKPPSGFLIKAPKQGQDLRVDLPAIGPKTIAAAKKAGLCGVAVEAGKVLVLDRDEVAAQAEAAGLFFYGF